MTRLGHGVRSIVLVSALLLIGGCGAREIRVSPEFSALRAGGYRIAMLPFRVSAAEDGVLTSSLVGFGALLSLEGVGDSAAPLMKAGIVMRRSLAATLAGGPIAVDEIWATDTKISHLGIPEAEIYDRKNAGRLCKLLGVRGILYGDVYRWNRSYRLLQSVQSVGLETELVDGERGETIFHAKVLERAGAGLSGGPTGQASVVLEPIKGLSGEALEDLATDVVSIIAGEMRGNEVTDGVDCRKGTGETPAISFLSVVREREGALGPGDTLRVIAVGCSDAEARFDIGSYRTGIPMVEVDRTPDPRGARTTYTGTYVLQEGESIEGFPVYVSLRSTHGGVLACRQRVMVP